jgi:hypothetical protein
VEDLKPLQAPVSGYNVTEGVDLSVAHVQVPGRIGKHIQDVFAGPAIVLHGNNEGLGLFPHSRPLSLYGAKVVKALGFRIGAIGAVAHRSRILNL